MPNVQAQCSKDLVRAGKRDGAIEPEHVVSAPSVITKASSAVECSLCRFLGVAGHVTTPCKVSALCAGALWPTPTWVRRDVRSVLIIVIISF